MEKKKNIWVDVAILGAMTGLRSMSTLPVPRWMSLGETVADKLPGVPSRTNPVSLIGRAVIGGVVGHAAASEEGSKLPFVLLAAATAVSTAFLASHARQAIAAKSRMASTLAGFAEDRLVAWAGSRG